MKMVYELDGKIIPLGVVWFYIYFTLFTFITGQLQLN